MNELLRQLILERPYLRKLFRRNDTSKGEISSDDEIYPMCNTFKSEWIEDENTEPIEVIWSRLDLYELEAHLVSMFSETLRAHIEANVPFVHLLAELTLREEDEARVEQLVDYLLQSGYDLNLRSNKLWNKSTALHVAAKRGNLILLNLLLIKTVVNLNTKNSNAHTPLMSAVLSKQFESFELLFQAGAMVRLKKDEKEMILKLAIRKDCAEIVDRLLEDEIVEWRFSDLQTCIVKEKYKCAQIFTKYDIHADETNRAEESLLRLLILVWSNPGFVDKVILMKALIRAISNVERCIAFFPISCITDILMQHSEITKDHQGCISNINFPKNCTHLNILHLMCMLGVPEMIRFLVEKANININLMTKGRTQLSPLQILLIYENWDDAVYMIDKGADLNITAKIQRDHAADITYPCVEYFTSRLILSLVSRSSYPAAKRIIQMTGPSWSPLHQFQAAVLGKDLKSILQILNTQEFKNDNFNLYEWTCINNFQIFGINDTQIPTLVYVLHTFYIKRERDIETLKNIIKTMYDLGYDLNLTMSEEEAEELNPVLRVGYTEPIIFSVLNIVCYLQNTDLLVNLLKFEKVNLKVLSVCKKSPKKYLTSIWGKFNGAENMSCIAFSEAMKMLSWWF